MIRPGLPMPVNNRYYADYGSGNNEMSHEKRYLKG